MLPFPQQESCRDIYIERRGYGLSVANPLQPLELAQGAIEVAFGLRVHHLQAHGRLGADTIRQPLQNQVMDLKR